MTNDFASSDGFRWNALQLWHCTTLKRKKKLFIYYWFCSVFNSFREKMACIDLDARLSLMQNSIPRESNITPTEQNAKILAFFPQNVYKTDETTSQRKMCYRKDFNAMKKMHCIHNHMKCNTLPHFVVSLTGYFCLSGYLIIVRMMTMTLIAHHIRSNWIGNHKKRSHLPPFVDCWLLCTTDLAGPLQNLPTLYVTMSQHSAGIFNLAHTHLALLFNYVQWNCSLRDKFHFSRIVCIVATHLLGCRKKNNSIRFGRHLFSPITVFFSHLALQLNKKLRSLFNGSSEAWRC